MSAEEDVVYRLTGATRFHQSDARGKLKNTFQLSQLHMRLDDSCSVMNVNVSQLTISKAGLFLKKKFLGSWTD